MAGFAWSKHFYSVLSVSWFSKVFASDFAITVALAESQSRRRLSGLQLPNAPFWNIRPLRSGYGAGSGRALPGLFLHTLVDRSMVFT